MKKTTYALSFALWAALLLSACGGADNAPAQDAGAVSVATPTGADASSIPAPTQTSSAPTARSMAPAGRIDPRASEPCAILDGAAVADIVGSSLSATTPGRDAINLACLYQLDNDKALQIEINLFNSGKQAYDAAIKLQGGLGFAIEDVALGEAAAIAKLDNGPVLYMVVDGWFVALRGYNVEEQALVEAGRLLTNRLIAFTPTTIAEVAPTPAPGSGGLIDMEVAIEAPPEMAGVTKLSSLNIIPPFAGFAICSFRTTATPFMLMFAVPPGQNPPTPVATFQFVASAAVTPNQPTPANFEVGLFKSASEDPQMFAGDGVIIVASDGKSGTFETRRMKGRWSCTFAE